MICVPRYFPTQMFDFVTYSSYEKQLFFGTMSILGGVQFVSMIDTKVLAFMPKFT